MAEGDGGHAVIRVISLGAGVQSTTMALMAAKGEITPMPDCAIFADTGWEPKKIYAHLDWLEKQLPFPVHRVSGGNLREALVGRASGGTTSVRAVPFFIKRPDGELAMALRQCTKAHKLDPIWRKCRDLLGYAPRTRIPARSLEMWIGISTDEMVRMKDPMAKWLVHRWPLIEKRMNRNDCLQWMSRSDYPEPAKSSCLGCPYHNDRQWREIRDGDPEGWADAVEVDRLIRRMPGVRGEQYMHRSMVPLDEVDLSTAEERGQLNFFHDECDGMCGV